MVVLCLALVLAQSPTAPRPLDRLIGLVTLPQVFGTGPCVPFEPQPIALHTAPLASEPIARLQVDKNWTFHQIGGCDGLEVRIHQPGRPAVPLPTEEFEYGAPAAVVVGRDGEWFQIRTANGPLWFRGAADNVYLPLVELLGPQRLTHLTLAWDGAMYATPGGRRLPSQNVPSESIVRVLDSEQRDGDLWLLVETAAGCDPDEPKQPTIRGWVQAYGRRGQPAVWFHSRGC